MYPLYVTQYTGAHFITATRTGDWRIIKFSCYTLPTVNNYHYPSYASPSSGSIAISSATDVTCSLSPSSSCNTGDSCFDSYNGIAGLSPSLFWCLTVCPSSFSSNWLASVLIRNWTLNHHYGYYGNNMSCVVLTCEMAKVINTNKQIG